MKNSFFHINQKWFLFLLFLCITETLIFSQTIVDIEPERLVGILTERFFNKENDKSGETLIEKVDSVMYNDIAIGYIFYYKPNGFAIIPKFREINPLFAFLGRTLDESEVTNHETFLKEELERRYLAIIYKEMSQLSIKRNEKMWQQFLLADISF